MIKRLITASMLTASIAAFAQQDDLNVTGDLTVDGETTLSGAAQIGQARVGEWPDNSTFAYFMHKGLNSFKNYAILQSSTGRTLINAKSTEGIYFRLSNNQNGDAHPMTLRTEGLGLGTNTPQRELHVKAKNNDGILLEASTEGNSVRFEMKSNDTHNYVFLNTLPPMGAHGLRMYNTSSGNGMLMSNNKIYFGNLSGAGPTLGADVLMYGKLEVGSKLSAVGNTLNDRMLDVKGRVVIGDLANADYDASSTDYKLLIAGKIGAEGIKCDLNHGWADFVFAENYELTPLKEVEEFVKENQHLPEVPAAATLEKEGVDITNMLTLQMQKIEELTLYIIAQEKRISELESK